MSRATATRLGTSPTACVSTAGTDGILGNEDDGGDLDGLADGNITTTWYVNPDDSYGETFLLTAKADTDGNGVYGDGTDALGTWSFTDGDMQTTWVNSGYLEDANVIDITALPPAESLEQGNVGGNVWFQYAPSSGAGTGNIDSFLRLSGKSNDSDNDANTEHGFNTDQHAWAALTNGSKF